MQERKELQAHLASTDGKHVDVEALESEFVNVAQEYGGREGISYATWREAGAPAEVVLWAGIGRGQDQRL